MLACSGPDGKCAAAGHGSGELSCGGGSAETPSQTQTTAPEPKTADKACGRDLRGASATRCVVPSCHEGSAEH
jgi:hypothetical protein